MIILPKWIVSISLLLIFISPVIHANDSLGQQHTAVILIDMVKNGKEVSPETYKEAIFSGEYSINNFIKENSYQRTWLTGEVYGWFDASGFENPAIAGCVLSIEQVWKLISDQVTLNAFDRYLVYFHQNRDCDEPGLGHALSFGKKKYQTPQGEINTGVTVMNAVSRFVKPKLPHQKLGDITSTTSGHELGHSLGIHSHANLFDCGKEMVSLDEKECKQEGIADMFSLMSGESYFRPAMHYNSCHKEDIGWFNEGEVLEVKPSEESSIVELFPYETNAHENVMVVKIPLKNPIPINKAYKVTLTYLYLEYRAPIGFDSNLTKLTEDISSLYSGIHPHPQYYPDEFKVDINGIQIRGGFFRSYIADGELQTHCNTTYLIDTKPQSIKYKLDPYEQEYSLYDHLDAFLLKDESFLEPYNNIKITNLGLTPQGAMKIKIEFL